MTAHTCVRVLCVLLSTPQALLQGCCTAYYRQYFSCWIATSLGHFVLIAGTSSSAVLSGSVGECTYRFPLHRWPVSAWHLGGRGLSPVAYLPSPSNSWQMRS